MTYATMLAERAASKALPALAEKVRKLEKQRAAVLDRLQNERDDLDRAARNITAHKEVAGERLASSTSDYKAWQGKLRRLTLELETAREALALLEGETRPAVEKELWETRGKLSQALDALCLAARPAAEARMAELLGAVVSEHDEFLGGCARLFLDHGLVFTPPPRYSGPRCEHPRLDHIGKHRLTSAAPFLAFTVPPAPATPAPQAAPVDVPDRQAVPDSTISAPPDAGAALKEDAAASPGVETSAQDASGATNGDGADALPYPPEDSEKKATRLPTILTGDVAGTDPDADTLPPGVDPEAEGGAI